MALWFGWCFKVDGRMMLFTALPKMHNVPSFGHWGDGQGDIEAETLTWNTDKETQRGGTETETPTGDTGTETPRLKHGNGDADTETLKRRHGQGYAEREKTRRRHGQAHTVAKTLKRNSAEENCPQIVIPTNVQLCPRLADDIHPFRLGANLRLQCN